MNDPLWSPSPERVARANMTRFAATAGARAGANLFVYADLHQWSIDHPEAFWDLVWQETGVIGDPGARPFLEDAERMPGARFFPRATLNFAENLLRFDDDRVALVGRLENGSRATLTYSELRAQVASLARRLRKLGVAPGDRVAAFMPNVPETVVGMLAATSLGAVWSSCSPDFGVAGVLDRFGQIAPKVLLACDGYFYNGKTIDSRPVVNSILEAIEPIEHVVYVTVAGTGALQANQSVHAYQDLAGDAHATLTFERLPFDHPLYIMYSSGTTGIPKCIVHGAGGTLLQHAKEHVLHVGLTREDTLFYFTTCGWMMWNWLVSGLSVGATLVLYDGSPFHPDPQAVIDIAAEESLTVFGTSAKYISALEKAGVRPTVSHELNTVHTILSTGSPLSHEGFKYVYRDFKPDVCLASISGGTDIISCFALGNETLAVHEGELQCAGLGMDVAFYADDGSATVGVRGELVCRQPFPSMPTGFWNDPDGTRFHAAYFDRFPNTWAHGDYGESTANGGVIIYGRSDAVLNPGGVRIGTAEIYRQVEKVDAVVDSICVGQDWEDDVRVVLFVVLREGLGINADIQAEIRQTIRANATPRHVPAVIAQVPDIPRTISGKIVELAVRNVIHGLPVRNQDALANPEALAAFRDRPELR
ncbi:MAG: acetoacetate--CoA ligase [Gammaproteobacteria bacterium]|nr:acetoacetate--CoA ligase [Gammaproteobacteria bacterium]